MSNKSGNSSNQQSTTAENANREKNEKGHLQSGQQGRVHEQNPDDRSPTDGDQRDQDAAAGGAKSDPHRQPIRSTSGAGNRSNTDR